MPMPEAAPSEDDFAASGKDQVERSGQVAAMQAEAIAEAVVPLAYSSMMIAQVSSLSRK